MMARLAWVRDRFVAWLIIGFLTLASASAQYRNLFLPRQYWTATPERIPSDVIAEARRLTESAVHNILMRLTTPVLSQDRRSFESVRFFQQLIARISQTPNRDLRLGPGTLRAIERYLYRQMLSQVRDHPDSDPRSLLQRFASMSDHSTIPAENVFFVGSDIDLYAANADTLEDTREAVEELATGESEFINRLLIGLLSQSFRATLFQEVDVLRLSEHMEFIARSGGGSLDRRSYSLQDFRYLDPPGNPAGISTAEDFFRGRETFIDPIYETAPLTLEGTVVRQLRHFVEAPWTRLESGANFIRHLNRISDVYEGGILPSSEAQTQLEKFLGNGFEDELYLRFRHPRTALDHAVHRYLKSAGRLMHRNFLAPIFIQTASSRVAGGTDSTEMRYYAAPSPDAALGALNGHFISTAADHPPIYRDSFQAVAIAGAGGFVVPIRGSQPPGLVQLLKGLSIRAHSATVPVRDRLESYQALNIIEDHVPALASNGDDAAETPAQFLGTLTSDLRSLLRALAEPGLVIPSQQLARCVDDFLVTLLDGPIAPTLRGPLSDALLNVQAPSHALIDRLLVLLGDPDFSSVAAQILKSELLAPATRDRVALSAQLEEQLTAVALGAASLASAQASFALWASGRNRSIAIQRALGAAFSSPSVDEASLTILLSEFKGYSRTLATVEWIQWIGAMSRSSRPSVWRGHALHFVRTLTRDSGPSIDEAVGALTHSVDPRQQEIGAHLALVLGSRNVQQAAGIFLEIYRGCRNQEEREALLLEIRQSALVAPRSVHSVELYVPVFCAAAHSGDARTVEFARTQWTQILNRILRGVELETSIIGLALFEDMIRSGLMTDAMVDGFVRNNSSWEYSPYVQRLIMPGQRLSALSLRYALAAGRSFRADPSYCVVDRIPR